LQGTKTGTGDSLKNGDVLNFTVVNWQKGLKRLYTVAAVCWAAFFLFGAAMATGRDGNFFVIMAFAVPAAAYVLFFVVFPWIARGFK